MKNLAPLIMKEVEKGVFVVDEAATKRASFGKNPCGEEEPIQVGEVLKSGPASYLTNFYSALSEISKHGPNRRYFSI